MYLDKRHDCEDIRWKASIALNDVEMPFTFVCQAVYMWAFASLNSCVRQSELVAFIRSRGRTHDNNNACVIHWSAIKMQIQCVDLIVAPIGRNFGRCHPRYLAACIFVVKIFIDIVNRDTRGTMADYYVTRAAPSHTMNVCRTWRHFRSNKHTYKIVKHSKNVMEITLKSQANILTASFDNIL